MQSFNAFIISIIFEHVNRRLGIFPKVFFCRFREYLKENRMELQEDSGNFQQSRDISFKFLPSKDSVYKKDFFSPR